MPPMREDACLPQKPDGSIQYTLMADIRELAISHRRHLELARLRQLDRVAGHEHGVGAGQDSTGRGNQERERDHGMER